MAKLKFESLADCHIPMVRSFKKGEVLSLDPKDKLVKHLQGNPYFKVVDSSNKKSRKEA